MRIPLAIEHVYSLVADQHEPNMATARDLGFVMAYGSGPRAEHRESQSWTCTQGMASAWEESLVASLANKLGTRQLAAAWRRVRPDHVLAVAFPRHAVGGSELCPEERTFLERLEPHIARATAMQQRLSIGERLLDELSEGIVLTNPQGLISLVNSSARQILEAPSNGLGSENGVLTARNPACKKRLREALLLSGRTATEQHLAVCTAAHPYRVTIVPLAPEKSLGTNSEQTLAVLIADPSRDSGEAIAWLMTGYELTQAEARVACSLAHGHTLETIAASQGVQASTVRSHLKRVFAKMSVQRQADVVRAVALGTGGLRVRGFDRGAIPSSMLFVPQPG